MTKNPAFELFKDNFPEVHASFNQLFQSVSTSALDEKTKPLVYLGVLTTTGYAPAIRVHIQDALRAGATKEEIQESILLSIPATGTCNFLKVLPEVVEELAD